jgi:hypothetical protein
MGGSYITSSRLPELLRPEVPLRPIAWRRTAWQIGRVQRITIYERAPSCRETALAPQPGSLAIAIGPRVVDLHRELVRESSRNGRCGRTCSKDRRPGAGSASTSTAATRSSPGAQRPDAARDAADMEDDQRPHKTTACAVSAGGAQAIRADRGRLRRFERLVALRAISRRNARS